MSLQWKAACCYNHLCALCTHHVKLWSKFTEGFFDQRGGLSERHFCALFRVYCGSALRPCAAKEPVKAREGILIGEWLSSYVRYSYWHSGRTNSLQHKQILNIRCRMERDGGKERWEGEIYAYYSFMAFALQDTSKCRHSCANTAEECVVLFNYNCRNTNFNV